MVTTISTYDPRANLQIGKNSHHPNGGILAEIEGLITVYNDGRVERTSIVPNVAASLPQHLGVTCGDVAIFSHSRLWARVYVPSGFAARFPVLVYFHGGGFSVGSAAWKCYHEFLANVSSQIPCVVVSVNYRLAPEHRLPAAYDDGVRAVAWVKQQASNSYSGGRDLSWWTEKCDFSRIFLAGDSAGANIAYNVASRLNTTTDNALKGLVLIQPFFGGEARTNSEKHTAQPPFSALTLHASDAYWALALPEGGNRDHPWCNPLATRMNNLKLPPTMVCISEMDILKDRNIGFCAALASAAATTVEKVVYKGVGHAFQILHNSPLSQPRTHEMMSHLKAFVVHHH